MDIKNTNAAQTTKTYNRDAIENQTENIYEAISIISKRAEQKKAKKEAKRQSEREVKRREKQARKFCISSIPKTIWRWITEPYREIYYW